MKPVALWVQSLLWLILGALLCVCHTGELGKCHLTKQSTFKSNFKLFLLKCCWTAAHTRSFQEHLPLGSNKWLPDHGLKFPGHRTAVFSCSDPNLCSSPCERGIDPLWSMCLQGQRYPERSQYCEDQQLLSWAPTVVTLQILPPFLILSNLSCSQYTSCPAWWNFTVPILNCFFLLY